jgi:hypothetical protein
MGFVQEWLPVRPPRIAEQLPGRSVWAVQDRKTVLKEGERPVREHLTEAEDAALRGGFESGKTWREIADDCWAGR